MSSANPEDKKPTPEQDPLAPENIPEIDETGFTADSAIPVGEEPAQNTNPDIDYPQVVETLRTELSQMKDQAMRALAEAENARTRARKDREEASKFAVSSFAKDLLSVADNLRRALDAIPAELLEQHDQVKNLVDGIEATEREMLRSFERNNIVKIDPKGQPFDPNFHEVLFEAPIPGTPAGTVIEVIETGYALNGRILRPARVGIAKDDGSGTAPTGNTDPGSQIDTEA